MRQIDLEEYPGVRMQEPADSSRLWSAIEKHHYRVILADPPWSFRNYSNQFNHRSAQAHYNTLTLDDICALPVADFAARDCHLFLWVTGSHFPAGLKVMESWGFEFSASGFVWVKTKADGGVRVGMGHTTRKSAEFCLLGRRGSPKRKSKAVREVIMAPRREHSRKPDETYDRIHAYADGPYLELFARQQWPGWTAWGNQTDRFAPPRSPAPLEGLPDAQARPNPDLPRRASGDGRAEAAGHQSGARPDDGLAGPPNGPAVPTSDRP